MVNTGDKITFHSHKLHKSWRKGNDPPSPKICSYRGDEDLRMVKAIDT